MNKWCKNNVKDQKVLCKLMREMKSSMYTKSIITLSHFISERVKTILEQNGYSVKEVEQPYHAKGWTRISW